MKREPRFPGVSGKIHCLLPPNIYRIYRKCGSVAAILLAVELGRDREWETEGRRQFLAVELCVLAAAAAAAAAAAILKAAGAFLCGRADLLPCVENGAKTIGKRALGGSIADVTP